MSQRRDGGLRLSGGQSGGHAPDRRWRGWLGIRFDVGECVRVECRWDADGDPSGWAGSISHRRECADATGVTQYGTRPHQSPRVHRLSEVWTSDREWSTWSGAAGIVHPDRDRTRFAGTLTFVIGAVVLSLSMSPHGRAALGGRLLRGPGFRLV